MIKKSLLALALAGAFASTASAQTKVEVYGVLDGGLQSITRADIDGKSQSSTVGVQTGINYGNRLGLRGSEELGRGLKAIFVLENGYELDTGKMGGGKLFGRQAFLGIEGQYATVAIGRLGTLGSTAGNFDMFWQADPFDGGFGDPGMITFANFDRVDNAAVIRSAPMAGLTLSTMYSFSASEPEQPGSSNNERYAAIGANYAVGNLWSALIYESLLAKDGGGQDQKVFKAAINYNFGPIKPYFTYSKADDVNWMGAVNSSQTYLIGATAPLLGGLVRASYQYLDGDGHETAAGTFAAEREVWSLGYTYDLSKRTLVYGVASLSTGGKSLDKDSQAGYVMSDSRYDVNRTVVSLGVTHSF